MRLQGQAEVDADSPPPDAACARATPPTSLTLQDAHSPASLVGRWGSGATAGCSEELRREVHQLQRERDMLVKQIRNQNSPLVWEKSQAVKRAAKAEGHVERLKQELDVARIRLEVRGDGLGCCAPLIPRVREGRSRRGSSRIGRSRVQRLDSLVLEGYFDPGDGAGGVLGVWVVFLRHGMPPSG